MKIVYQTADGKIFENRDEAFEYEDKINGQEKKLEVWVLNMPGTSVDGVMVVRKSEYEKLLSKLERYIK